MSGHTIGVKARRTIPREAGVITPDIVEELKEDLLDELADDLMRFAEAFGLVKWNIDGREINAELTLVAEETN